MSTIPFAGLTSKINVMDILGGCNMEYDLSDIHKYLIKHDESISGTYSQLEKRVKFTAQKLKNIKKIKRDLQEEKITTWLGTKSYTVDDLVTATKRAQLPMLSDCEQLKKQLIKYIDSIYEDAEKDERESLKEKIREEMKEIMKDEFEEMKKRLDTLDKELTKRTEIQSAQIAELEMKLNELETRSEKDTVEQRTEIHVVEEIPKSEVVEESSDDEWTTLD